MGMRRTRTEMLAPSRGLFLRERVRSNEPSRVPNLEPLACSEQASLPSPTADPARSSSSPPPGGRNPFKIGPQISRGPNAPDFRAASSQGNEEGPQRPEDLEPRSSRFEPRREPPEGPPSPRKWGATTTTTTTTGCQNGALALSVSAPPRCCVAAAAQRFSRA